MRSFSYLPLVGLSSFFSAITALPLQIRSPQPDPQRWTSALDSWSHPTATASIAASIPTASIPAPSPTSSSTTANPVLPKDFPDPSFLETDDGFYAFATSGNGAKVQIAHSPSFENPSWTHLSQDALPNPGSWTDGSSNIWAPYVFKAGNGNYVLYYSAPYWNNPSTHCVGAATSKTITGPYIASANPFICPISQGGAIDPSVFKDPSTGKVYVLYKVDGNSNNLNMPTPIKLQEVDATDGITPIGSTTSATTLIDKDANDGPLVEAPAMFSQNGIYYLLYSTHYYNTDSYDMRYATATSITGPYTMSDDPALFTGMSGLVSPGSADVDPQGGNILFHATVGFNDAAKTEPIRYMYGGAVSGQNGKVVFTGFANQQ